MKNQPLEQIIDKMDSIATQVKIAHNNGLCESEISKMMEVYNQYYYAAQLLQAFTDINHTFIKLVRTSDGKLTYKRLRLKEHVLRVD